MPMWMHLKQTDKIDRVPDRTLDQLAVNLALAPYWIVDLTRSWMDILPASDASEAFGLGLSVATA